MASIAARVDVGDVQEAVVAKSSRAGTKRIVKALPTKRGCPARMGRVPRNQTLRKPFFNKMVVMVAVEIVCNVLMIESSSDISIGVVVGALVGALAVGWVVIILFLFKPVG